jgi:hypothetical protein
MAVPVKLSLVTTSWQHGNVGVGLVGDSLLAVTGTPEVGRTLP